MTVDVSLVLVIAVAAAVVAALVASLVTRRVLRGAPTEASEEEIRDLVTINDELAPAEKRMINEVIDLGDMTVQEVMKPRVDMMMAEDTETVRQAIERMRGTGYSRLPVFHEDADNIVGIVYYKNLLQPVMDGAVDETLGSFATEAMFVPETKDLLPLLSEMQAQHCTMCIVVDEYGGTAGLATIEDIVEEVVGEIRDETDRERGLVEQVRAGEWRALGNLPVEDALALGWPVEDSDDYETLAGWLLDQADEVPHVGDELVVGGFTFRIEGMRRHRIQRVHVLKMDE